MDECRNSHVIDAARVVIHEVGNYCLQDVLRTYKYVRTQCKDNFHCFIYIENVKIKENIASGHTRVQFETIDC